MYDIWAHLVLDLRKSVTAFVMVAKGHLYCVESEMTGSKIPSCHKSDRVEKYLTLK